MRQIAILFLALTLAGCLPDRAKDLAACQKEADRFYLPYKATDPENPSSRYIIGCMAAKGYEFTIAPSACNSQHPFPTQASCYTPSNWLVSIIDRLHSEQ
jgi:hypothetical protein